MLKKFNKFILESHELDPYGEEDWDDEFPIIDDYWNLVDSMGLCPSYIRKIGGAFSFGFNVLPLYFVINANSIGVNMHI